MKRLAILTITSVLAVGAFGAFGGAAFAENETVYPDDGEFFKPLTFTSLSDFAADGDTYAFAENEGGVGTIYYYSAGELEIVATGDTVERLDCFDGVFYYADDRGTVYELLSREEANYSMPEPQTTLIINEYEFYSLIGSTLKYTNVRTDQIVSLDGEFGHLKRYGSTVYAICDNALYVIDGAQATAVSLEYTDFSATQQIFIGQTVDALKQKDSLTFVRLKAGSYLTEINLTDVDGEYFSVRQTATVEEETVALLLCYTGNAAVVAVGDASYITLRTSTEETTVDCYTQAPFTSATITGGGIYASPYVIASTSLLSSAAGKIVSVLHKIEYDGVLGSAYYEVEYVENGETLTGYVAEGFLTESIIQDNEELKEIDDPEYSEDNDVRTILLVFAIVVLVLIALGYLTYIGTSGKKKKTNKKSAPESENNDNQE